MGKKGTCENLTLTKDSVKIDYISKEQSSPLRELVEVEDNNSLSNTIFKGVG